MKYSGIIFDLDGVICHTDQYHYKAWKMIADKLGVEFNEEINNHLRGISRLESLEIVLKNYNGVLTENEKAMHLKEKNEFYKELLADMSKKDLSDDVKKTLVELRDKGLKLAIGSSSKNAKFILKQIGLEDFFDAISDGNNISNSKPNPEVFIKAAEMIDIENEKCLVVEDAGAGIEAACNAGMDSVAIGVAKKNAKATYRINMLSEILDIL